MGYSISEIYKASGKKVYKTQIINDRGIHICKSMIAWLDYGNGETPASTNLKGDKFVGDYYIKFDQVYKKEVEELIKVELLKKRLSKMPHSTKSKRNANSMGVWR